MADWICGLPRAEALWLGGGHGPLATRGLPGIVTIGEDGKVTLDQQAFRSLAHLGCLSGDEDGRLVYFGGVPVLMFGREAYELKEVPGAPQGG